MTVGLGVEFFGDKLMVGVDDVDDCVFLIDGIMFLKGGIVGVKDSALAHTFAAALLASHPAFHMS